MTARDLIGDSLKLIGVLADGETPTAGQQSDGLNVLNDMLDAWSIEDMAIFARASEDFSLRPGQADYGMGPAGDFNTTRPLGIDGISIVDGTAEFQMDEQTLDLWMAIQTKSVQSSIPTKYYINETFPLLTITFWPVPSITKTARLYTWKALTQIATAGTEISFPPGYAQALKFNLAILLSPGYGRQVDPTVAAVATVSKGNIKIANAKLRILAADKALATPRRYNILRGV